MTTEQQVAPTPKFIRFTSGDDIVSEMVELEAPDETIQYLLINPLKLVYIPVNQGMSYTIGFMPFIFPRLTEQQEFKINPINVLLMSDVSDKIASHYYESLDEIAKVYDESETETESLSDNGDNVFRELLEEMTQGGKKTFH